MEGRQAGSKQEHVGSGRRLIKSAEGHGGAVNKRLFRRAKERMAQGGQRSIEVGRREHEKVTCARTRKEEEEYVVFMLL